MLSLFSHWLCYANSAINPVIYNFMSGKLYFLLFFLSIHGERSSTTTKNEMKRQNFPSTLPLLFARSLSLLIYVHYNWQQCQIRNEWVTDCSPLVSTLSRMIHIKWLNCVFYSIPMLLLLPTVICYGCDRQWGGNVNNSNDT